MGAILKVEGLKKYYGKRCVLQDLSFVIHPGEIVSLLGPNGAGKTTAFYITIGLIRPDAGQITFLDNDITHAPIYKRARMGMGYLAQEPSVFRNLTVEDNILCILETLGLEKKEQSARLEVLLEELHLTSLAKEMATSLSGGERRRLEITRALVRSPSLLLLDEPFANIDPMAIHDVKQMLRLLTKKKISVLITDHNAREIFSITDRSYIIKKGQVIVEGTVDELINSKEAKEHYLGNDFKI
jgi:lipopolysaccharide export system ATP-binding protein